jgi:uncharacterized glyoxalase superfamily protein PhnB
MTHSYTGAVDERSFPIISVRDVAACQRFYERLGFHLSYRFPSDGEPVFITLERAGSSIGIGLVDRETEDVFAFWVYVDDVDVTFQALVAAGATIVAEPAEQPWGERVAQARDPEGNLVYLGMAI